jgi:sterol desaturase/sphingolipid hydroxylase (fatty acid hydroxylase superfamily)
MLENILYKLSLFHPTISNAVSLLFLALSIVFNVSYVNSTRDLVYYWYIRPIVTFFISAIIRIIIETLFPGTLFDLSGNNFFINIVLLYLLIDFNIYLIHFLMHKNKWLFHFHRIHHQIENLSWENGSKDTIVFEIAVVTIAVLFSYFLNISLMTTAITIFIWKFALAYTHSNSRYHSSWLNWLIISPEKHELHHTHSNKDDYNFSITLTFWDELYRFVRKLL